MKNEVQLQREYYTRTANAYESMHVRGDGEHDLACALMGALSAHYKLTSILDVGSGTGRAVEKLKQLIPAALIVGVEPVAAMREIGHLNGIPKHQLVEGDATRLTFADASFDLVCELGVLHHIPKPRQAVAEMLRVANKAIFLSDSNRFGQGSTASKYLKLLLFKARIWPLVTWIKTKGKGFHYGEGDGVSYSYSVFDDYDYICSQCEHVMVFNLNGSGRSALTGADSIGIFGIKKRLAPARALSPGIVKGSV